jgi:hypothetical protein
MYQLYLVPDFLHQTAAQLDRFDLSHQADEFSFPSFTSFQGFGAPKGKRRVARCYSESSASRTTNCLPTAKPG